MKQLYIIFILSVLSCGGKGNDGNLAVAVAVAETDFDWLLGSWERMNDEGENFTYETWLKIDSSTYHGVGHTLLNADTVWQEEMRLVNIAGRWNLEVFSKGDTAATVFSLTDITPEAFTSQNAENDFPKQIKYYRNEEYLKAIVSGEGMEISFDFKRN
ncbi:DUF6265 family protein [Anditalea andensis]|nr:DUF6265 family protein [Anditalea andensis]